MLSGIVNMCDLYMRASVKQGVGAGYPLGVPEKNPFPLHKSDRIATALDGGEIHMLLRLAEVGLGLALMPPLALSCNERLAQLSVRDQDLRRTVGLVSRRDRALIPAAALMRDFQPSDLSNPDTVTILTR